MFAPLIAILIVTLAFSGFAGMEAHAQKKISVQFVFQPGTSFVSGQWKIISPLIYTTPFKRNLTPTLETGVNAVFHFTRKRGDKIIYDEMYESGGGILPIK